MNKVLVTGGSGFIGRHVVAALRKRDCEVKSLSKSDGDLSDSQFCDQVVADCDTVVHLAWSTSPYTSNLDPIEEVRTNIQGSISLFRACIRAGTKRIIFISSGGTVYGEPEKIPIPESHPIQPLSSYGIAKVTVEHYLQFLLRNSDSTYVILRGANAYGPGQNFSTNQGVIGNWLNCLMDKNEITVYGDGSQIRDYLYISDFVKAVVLATECEHTKTTLNIGSGTGYSLLEIIDTLQEVTGMSPKIHFVEQRNFDVPTNVLDCKKASSVLVWRPAIGLKEGIRKTWKWIQDQETSDR